MIKSAFILLSLFGLMSVINSIILSLVPVVLPPVAHEIYHVLTAFLPFRGSTIFPVIAMSVSTILTMILAEKVFFIKESFVNHG